MRQGIQIDLKDREINEYGCYALCIIRWAEIDKFAEFSDDEVMEIINGARHMNVIGDECFVLNPPLLYNFASNGYKRMLSMTKTTAPSKPTSIACNKKPMYTHFTFWHDGQTWDPLPPNRPSAKSYKIDSWRVLS